MTVARCFVRRSRHLALLAVLIGSVMPVHASAQLAAFSGRVLQDGTERPIAGALVELRALGLRALSDSSGAFRIVGVRPGPQDVIVRAIGFDSVAATVPFVANESVESDFLMASASTRLEAVKVEARLTGLDEFRLREFEDRRKGGLGRFLDREYFEQYKGRRLSELLMGRIAGIHVRRQGSKSVLESRRNGKSCPLQVIVNGVVRFNGGGGHYEVDLDRFLADEMLGFEFYTVAATPLRFSGSALGDDGGSTCGTAVIWTR